MTATVLIIDGGARGHAISCAYEASKHVKRIIVAPGNDFISYGRKKEVLVEKKCNLNDPQSILQLAQQYQPDLVDIAQDDALASGAVNLLTEKGFMVFGPTREAARIEWDKRWSKEFMKRHNIPTARFESFSDVEQAIAYVASLYREQPRANLYIKATGLCAGKGALSARTAEEAIYCIRQMKSFGAAGEAFLIEEGLVGEEFSCYAISDGSSYRLFKSAQDHKKANTFDVGPQTGGMGAISPAMVTDSLASRIETTLIAPIIKGMEVEGIPYTGILYVGGIAVDTQPFVIEYNARWGDPECQAALPALTTDYYELVTAAIESRLHIEALTQDSQYRVCVVGALRGYPGDTTLNKGAKVFGIDEVMKMDGVHVFGAGISSKDGYFTATGGRLFSIVGEGGTIIEARERAYAAISRIHLEGNNLHYRTDIGWNDVERFYDKQ